MLTARERRWTRTVTLGGVLLAWTTLSLDADAQDTNAPPTPIHALRIDEALAYAHAHQPAIEAARASIAAARADAGIPRSQWLPQLGVTAQIFGGTANNTTASYATVGSMDIPRIGGSKFSASGGSFRPYASTLVGAGLNQEVFDFGRIAAQSAAADTMVEIEKQNANNELLELDLGVKEAFYAVRAAHSVVEASESAFTRAQAHRDLAKAGVDGGLRSPIELTRAEADLSRFNVGRIRARGGLASAESGLAAAVGSPELTLDAAEGALAPEDVPSLQQAMDLASRRDPIVREAMARLAAQQARTTAISAELRPDIALTASITGRAGGAPATSGDISNYSGLVPNVPNWDAGLVLSWQLYDGTVRARADASRRREDVEHAQIEVARKQEVAAVEQAYVAFEVARSALPALERAREAAIANDAQADARFKSGIGTSVELADAEALRTQAEIDVAIGRFEVARARAALSRAIAEGL